MHRQAILIVGITIATLGSPVQSWAEGTQGASSQTAVPGAQPGVGRKLMPKEIRHDPLTSIPSDLKVPVPPDAKFSVGYRSQYNNSRVITEMQFFTNNPIANVTDWYQKSFQGMGWTANVDKSKTERHQIYAFKQGITCSMTLRSQGTNATTIILTYSEAR
ncbi:MAG TPA: hypothetical protein V6C97_02970 [Oculatellaceae cyanobacterium]